MHHSTYLTEPIRELVRCLRRGVTRKEEPGTSVLEMTTLERESGQLLRVETLGEMMARQFAISRGDPERCCANTAARAEKDYRHAGHCQ